jgi:phage-related minor tail protein
VANRIKGITIEIGGDTTKLEQSLKEVNGTINKTQSQLRDVQKLLKLDPGNTELLAQRQKLLGEAVGETESPTASFNASTALRYCCSSWRKFGSILLRVSLTF